MKLSPHFTLEEFLVSEVGARVGIDNTPDDEVIDNLRVLASTLQAIRIHLQHPIVITSGYRCSELNRLVGGADTSAHLRGWAADFTCPGYGPPLAVARAITYQWGVRFDQLIHEFGSWVHLSVDPRMRRQMLTIDRRGTRQGLQP
jgi:hypothetical protein